MLDVLESVDPAVPHDVDGDTMSELQPALRRLVRPPSTTIPTVNALADARRELLEFSLDGPPVLTFERSHDLFGDGSVLLVDLAGHTPGSVGVLLSTDDGPVLLSGDAAWHGLQVDQLRQRSGFLSCLVDVDRELTWRTLHRLHALPSSVRVVPAHDHERGSGWSTGNGGQGLLSG